jgi:putative acetyltransferase
MIEIDYAAPRHAGIRALLGQSHALMRALFSPEDNHFLEIDDLCVPTIHFFGARVDGAYRACGALAVKEGYGEIKSFFTDPAARGMGLGQKVLDKIQLVARELEITELRLETGVGLDAAHHLYRKNGFRDCGPFGDYPASEFSVFMEKTIGM